MSQAKTFFLVISHHHTQQRQRKRVIISRRPFIFESFYFRHSIGCKMPNFQAETFVFSPLEWWWPAGTLMGPAWPTGRQGCRKFSLFFGSCRWQPCLHLYIMQEDVVKIPQVPGAPRNVNLARAITQLPVDLIIYCTIFK